MFKRPAGATGLVTLIDHRQIGEYGIVAGHHQRPDRAVDGVVLDHATSWVTGDVPVELPMAATQRYAQLVLLKNLDS
jgi:hypothetical protein